LPDSFVKVLLLDFGGVIAEEGFREGLKDIARQAGLQEDDFFRSATALIYDCGYLTGRADEPTYWELVRNATGVGFTDEFMRGEILRRFVLRDWMLTLVGGLGAGGLRVAILSDQTQWLDELDANLRFFDKFEKVFNSYHMGISKRDPEMFSLVAAELLCPIDEILFVDDTEGHVRRARSKGMKGIHYQSKDQFLAEMREFGLPVD
jgi:FMN phosphatase YigB (HAD superfamily)